jgi:hypothetical protein
MTVPGAAVEQVFGADGADTEIAPDARSKKAAAIVLETKDGEPVIPTAAPGDYHYVTVNGLPFKPTDPADSYVVSGTSGSACIYNSSGAATGFSFPLRLPDGATVKYLRMFYDRTGSVTSTAYISRYGMGSYSASLVALNATHTAGGFNHVVSAEQSIVIDSYFNYYDLTWVGQPGSTNKFCGMRVTYELPSQGTYTPITPCRVLDTRGISPPNPPYGAPSLTGGAARNFQITGSCTVPSGAVAVSGNVSVTNTGGAGYVAIWKQGEAWPGNATVNYSAAAQTVGNSALIPLSATGQIAAQAFNTGTTDLIIDVTGWYY